MNPPKPTPPEHDPLSEEMDLITFQEADARLYEELELARIDLEDLKASSIPANQAEVTFTEERVKALEAVSERLREQRALKTPTKEK